MARDALVVLSVDDDEDDSVVCDECGAPNDVAAVFCDQCGVEFEDDGDDDAEE